MSNLASCLPETAAPVTVRTLSNILDKSTRVSWEEPAWRYVSEYAPEDFIHDPLLRIIYNGLLLRMDEAESVRARPGDEVIFYRAPGWEGILISLVVSLIIAGISYGIQALLAPAIHDRNDMEDSATYGFDGLVNTTKPGTRIPIVYGTHRVAGHILQQFQRPARDSSTADVDPKTGEMHTLLGLCEGPISQVSDVRVDKNPITDYGETVNWTSRLGDEHQEAIEGFRDIVTQRFKDAELKQVDPPLVFTTDDEVDGFEIIFRFPGCLYKLSPTAGFRQKAVSIKVEYRELLSTSPERQTLLSGRWLDGGIKKISAKSSGAFDSWYQSPVLRRASYQVQVTRITPDDSNATGVSGVSVLSLNDVLHDDLTYPGVALLAVRQLPTNQVSGRIPQYDCIAKGRLVRVFTTTTAYTTEWSDNPAWCLLDLLTSKAGLGAFISDSKVDLQSMIDFAAACAARNLHLNLVLDGSMTAIEAIQQICVTGQAYFLLRGDKWAVRVDQDEPPVQLFTMGRILRDSFAVHIDGKLDRANYFLGDFWNEEIDYERDQLPGPDPALIEGDEQVETAVNLVGSTNPSQVAQLLNYYILSNRLIKRTTEFEVGAEAIAMEAGDVFKVSHDVPGWGFSGILFGVNTTGTELQLDREVTIESGKVYELTAIHDTDAIDVVSVVNVPETTRRLLVSGDWSTLPKVGTHYSFGEVGRSTVLYRCMSITKGSSAMTRKIRAKEHNPDVYGQDLTVLIPPSVSRLPDPYRIPDPVRDLRLQERQVYAEDGTLSEAIDVHFTLPVIPMIRAQVYWRELGDLLWEPVALVDAGFASITDGVTSPGVTYEISVVTLSANGSRRHPDAGERAMITTVGTTRQPDKVTNFTADRTVNGLIFAWAALDPVKNFDLDYYELRQGTAWDSALLIGRTTDTSLETVAFVKGANTYLIKAFNTSGKGSAQAAVVVITVDGRIGENIVLTRQEDPTFPGTKQNFAVISSKLVLDTTDQVVAWRAQVESSPLSGGIIPGGRGAAFNVVGIYTTDPFQVTTLAAVRSLVSSVLEVNQVDLSLYWTAPGVGDQSWASEFGRTRQWAVAPDGKVRVKLEMRFSTATNAEADFGAWQERPQNFEVAVKWAQARITIEIIDPGFTAEVVKFRILIDVPDITDSGSVTSSATGTVAVTFAKLFNNSPKVALAVIGATAGDDPGNPTNVTNTGFDIEVKNAAGSRVVRTVHWIANGY